MTESLAKTLLIVEDDDIFRQTLSRAMGRKGFAVVVAEGIETGFKIAQESKPDYAVVDMRLKDGNGLDLVEKLTDLCPDCKIVVLTGYGNIATAVRAIKAGAFDYLPKPADAETIAATLLGHQAQAHDVQENPMPADRVRWEHILRVYEDTGRNVSETARRLQMHRRTLQRILAKHAPREQEE